MELNAKRLIEAGIRIADFRICEQDKIWSRYSHDKVDIGEELAKVIRTLNKALPLNTQMCALSIGSSAEPQFRILETAFRGRLYLLDIDNAALSIVRERICRQRTDHVNCIYSDYNQVFLIPGKTESFLRNKLGAKKINLVTLHHSMYYCPFCNWALIFENIYRKILARISAIHAVLMASRSDDRYTTTWLYNHFAGKFFGIRNDQDLGEFKKILEEKPLFKNAQILLKRNRVYFYVDDFVKFMAVVWMVLLYPNVHKYNLWQKEEITEFIYRNFWLKRRPVIQEQDHLLIYRGISFKGLI